MIMYITPESKDKAFAALPRFNAKLPLNVVVILVGSRSHALFAEGITFGAPNRSGDLGLSGRNIVELVLIGLCFGSLPSLGSRKGKLLLRSRCIQRVEQYFLSVHELIIELMQFSSRICSGSHYYFYWANKIIIMLV